MRSDWSQSLGTQFAVQAMNGQLEFFNVDEFEIMNAGEHFMCTDIEWDPTGRYVATSVTSVHQMENGFNVWSWNGHLLYRRAESCSRHCSTAVLVAIPAATSVLYSDLHFSERQQVTGDPPSALTFADYRCTSGPGLECEPHITFGINAC